MWPYLWMLSGAFCFSIMGALTHALASYCSWQVVALVRAALAFLFALTLAKFSQTQLVLWRPRVLWLRSIAGSISLLCTFYALMHLPPPETLTLTNMFPIWITLFESLQRKNRPSWDLWPAVACGFAGVVLIQRPHFDRGNFAAAVALASSFSTAVAMFGLHRLKNVKSHAVVAHFSGVSTLFCLVALAVIPQEQSPVQISLKFGGLLLGVGLSATAGQLFLTKAFAAGNPARVSVVALAQVVFAVGFDALFWRRVVPLESLVGMAMVLLPTAWLLWRGSESTVPSEA